MSRAGAGSEPTLVRAAVAIPVLLRDGRHQVLLTQRPEALPAHPGEICFPGGKVDPADASPLAAACRELREEVGVAPEKILSYRPERGCATSTGYYIEPFVMRVAGDVEIRPSAREVSRYTLLPLADVLALERYRIEGFCPVRDELVFVFPTGIGLVRGATCSLLLQLARQILRAGGFDAYARTFTGMSA